MLKGNFEAKQDLKEAHDDRTLDICADVLDDLALELRDIGNRDDAGDVMDISDAVRRGLARKANVMWGELDTFVRDKIANSIETDEEEDACRDILGVTLL